MCSTVNQKPGEVIMVVTAEQFSEWAFKISDVFVDGKGVDGNVWIVWEPFYYMQVMNDARCLPWGVNKNILITSYRRRNNV